MTSTIDFRDMASDVASASLSTISMKVVKDREMIFVQGKSLNKSLSNNSTGYFQSKVLLGINDFMELFARDECCITKVSVYDLLPEIVFNNPDRNKFFVHSNSFTNREISGLSTFYAGQIIGFRVGDEARKVRLPFAKGSGHKRLLVEGLLKIQESGLLQKVNASWKTTIP